MDAQYGDNGFYSVFTPFLEFWEIYEPNLDGLNAHLSQMKWPSVFQNRKNGFNRRSSFVMEHWILGET